MAVTEKQCRSCKRVLPLSEFERNGKESGATCNRCAEMAAKRYASAKAARRASGEKTCRHCGETRPLQEFIDGRLEFSACAACREEMDMERARRNLEAQQRREEAMRSPAPTQAHWAALRFPDAPGPFSAAVLGAEAMQWRVA